MAINKHPPIEITWVLLAALFTLLLGERAFDDISWFGLTLSFLSTAFIIFATFWRLFSWVSTHGPSKKIEAIFAFSYTGIVWAVLLYFLQDSTILIPDNLDQPAKLQTITQIGATILILASVMAMIAAYWSIEKNQSLDDAGIEIQRTYQLTKNALTIAFAIVFLGLTVYIATERNLKIDASYFKTSTPGQTSINMVVNSDDPIKVYLFFPAINQVRDEVKSYLDELSHYSKRLIIEESDRIANPKLAKKYRVRSDGFVVMTHRDQHYSILLSTDIKKARPDLKNFDEKIQEALYHISRPSRTAYFIVGHGEFGDREDEGRSSLGLLLSVDALKEQLKLLNYKTYDLGVSRLIKQVPAGTDLVVIVGPQTSLLDKESAAIERYLFNGGSILIALDPDYPNASLTPALEKLLGVSYQPYRLVHNRQFYPMRRNISDKQNIITNAITKHPSVVSLDDMKSGRGILLLGTGSLESHDFDRTLYGDNPPKRTYIIRSLATTFHDKNGDFTYNHGQEKRASYNIAAAIEQQIPEPEKSDKKLTTPQKSMRALVFADAQLFSDAMLRGRILIHRQLVLDALRWLGKEENYQSKPKSEVDVRIRHTNAEDRSIFYAIILGAPSLFLLFGLSIIRIRNRKDAIS